VLLERGIAKCHNYTQRDIVLRVYDGDHLEEDFEKLRAVPSTSKEADVIDAFLTQIAESEDALWTLNKWSAEFSNPHFNCKAINCFQDSGYNIYRIRPLGRRISQFRILYAYDQHNDDYYLLAITIKKPDVLPLGATLNDYYDYEPNHPISQRVRSEYERLGLPRLN